MNYMTNNDKREEKVRSFIFSSKDMIKSVIRYILWRHHRLNAKEIQEIIGLKRQRTYDYLNELEESGELAVEYERLEDRPNINVKYYSINKLKLQEESDEYHKTEVNKKSTLRRINYSIAALIEAKTAIEGMALDEFKEYDDYKREEEDIWGCMPLVFFLKDHEYDDFYKGFFKLYKELEKKWGEEDKGKHDNNLLIIDFFKAFPSHLKTLSQKK